MAAKFLFLALGEGNLFIITLEDKMHGAMHATHSFREQIRTSSSHLATPLTVVGVVAAGAKLTWGQRVNVSLGKTKCQELPNAAACLSPHHLPTLHT